MTTPDTISDYQDPPPFSVETDDVSLTFLPCGQDRLDALLDMIASAQSSLDIFYYMFQDDACGTKVRDAIADAAQRGVKVRLLVDRFGTDAENSFFDPVTEAGGAFTVFSAKWSRRYFIRNHQKMTIADEQRAMVGGFNISNHYFAPPAENGWNDMGVSMTGATIAPLLDWYEKLWDWARDDTTQFRAIRKLVKNWTPGNGRVQLTLGGPTRAASNWARGVKRDLAQAEKLDVVMAYFSPPRSFRRHIRRIAKRGAVRLIMAGKSDNGATIGASRALYGGMLRKGAQIYEFQPSKLHMKLLVIDDVTYFGSANFDHRSIRLNLEMMFRIDDAGLAARIREFIDGLQDASVHVTYDLHRQRSNVWTQLQWRMGWFLVSTLDYTVTRRLNAGN
ncbi:phospholipase D-like domain-containing protein [Pontixanthobacter sp.]|uniref:phospholipase D-like domain-containing protein n=1 Tax=Pontixanthobacter sp. TaxID=2792078 RepID=UPI003C79C04B